MKLRFQSNLTLEKPPEIQGQPKKQRLWSVEVFLFKQKTQSTQQSRLVQIGSGDANQLFDSTVETPGKKTSMKIDEVFSDSSFWGLHKSKHGICQQQTIYHFASKIVRLMMIFLDVYAW